MSVMQSRNSDALALNGRNVFAYDPTGHPQNLQSLGSADSRHLLLPQGIKILMSSMLDDLCAHQWQCARTRVYHLYSNGYDDVRNDETMTMSSENRFISQLMTYCRHLFSGRWALVGIGCRKGKNVWTVFLYSPVEFNNFYLISGALTCFESKEIIDPCSIIAPLRMCFLHHVFDPVLGNVRMLLS